jgi:hypothetical protein
VKRSLQGAVRANISVKNLNHLFLMRKKNKFDAEKNKFDVRKKQCQSKISLAASSMHFPSQAQPMCSWKFLLVAPSRRLSNTPPILEQESIRARAIPNYCCWLCHKRKEGNEF